MTHDQSIHNCRVNIVSTQSAILNMIIHTMSNNDFKYIQLSILYIFHFRHVPNTFNFRSLEQSSNWHHFLDRQCKRLVVLELREWLVPQETKNETCWLICTLTLCVSCGFYSCPCQTIYIWIVKHSILLDIEWKKLHPMHCKNYSSCFHYHYFFTNYHDSTILLCASKIMIYLVKLYPTHDAFTVQSNDKWRFHCKWEEIIR